MKKNSGVCNNKARILYVLRYMWEETNEAHIVNCGDILAYLQKRGITAERKTIYSDIDALKDAGIAIENVRGKRGGYYISDRIFDLPELKILIDGIASSKFLTYGKSKSLINKLMGLCSKFDAEEIGSNLFITGRIKSMNESIFYNVDQINRAINQNKKISFKYFDYNVQKKKVFHDNGEKRIVSPYAMVLDSEKYYLVAYNHKENLIKHYRLDKIFAINILDEDRQKAPEEIVFPKYTDKLFSMYGGETKSVVMEFDAKLSHTVIDKFGKSIPFLNGRDDNHFMIRADVAISDQFFGWIFGLGDKARIISPPEVTELMAERLRQNLSFYTNKP